LPQEIYSHGYNWCLISRNNSINSSYLFNNKLLCYTRNAYPYEDQENEDDLLKDAILYKTKGTSKEVDELFTSLSLLHNIPKERTVMTLDVLHLKTTKSVLIDSRKQFFIFYNLLLQKYNFPQSPHLTAYFNMMADVGRNENMGIDKFCVLWSTKKITCLCDRKRFLCNDTDTHRKNI
jgi:hypothetical protein